MQFVILVLSYVVVVVVCDSSWMDDKMGYYDKERDVKSSTKGDSKAGDDGMTHKSVDKDNNMFHSNVDLDQFMTRRGKEDFDRHGVPPFDDDDDHDSDDHMRSFSMDDEELSKRSANGKSFSLDDDMLSKKGADGKPVSFKMSNKGDGRGFKEEFDDEGDDDKDGDFPSDDFDMPGDMGDHDFSSFPFTDHGSPFKDQGFPFNDHSFDDDDESMAMDGDMEKDDYFHGSDRFGKGDGNVEDLDAMHERLKESFIKRQKEHDDYLQEKREMMEDADYSLGIMPKDEKRKKKEEGKKEKGKKDEQKKANDVNDGKKSDDELLKERTMTTQKHGDEETHCWDVVVSMTCKRVELVDYPFSKRVCDNRKIEKRCTKVESKKE